MSPPAEVLQRLEAAEQALDLGDAETARQSLDGIGEEDVPDAFLRRFVDTLVAANRLHGQHATSLEWIERALAIPHDDAATAVLLRARVECVRSLDTRRALDLADEALAACEKVDDEYGFATVLAHAAFAAYRRGEVREAQRFAHMATARSFKSPVALVMALRARTYAATAAGQLEQALDVSMEIRDRTLGMSDYALAANEYTNIAESQLKLGRPLSAIEAATRAIELADRVGYDAVARFARVLVGVGMAENGDLDTGIAMLRRAETQNGSPVLANDTMASLAFWLVERNDEGDAQEALDLAQLAVAKAREVGLHHYMTTILSTEARALELLGEGRHARAALEEARSAFDTADTLSERHLALAMGEVLPPGDATRRTALGTARAHLLRDAGNRDDPLAYCTGVRIHRRLLEMTGGVPLDLPRAR